MRGVPTTWHLTCWFFDVKGGPVCHSFMPGMRNYNAAHTVSNTLVPVVTESEQLAHQWWAAEMQMQRCRDPGLIRFPHSGTW